MDAICKALQNGETVITNELITVLNEANENQRCYILNLLPSANNLLAVNWSYSSNELLYLLPKLSIDNIKSILLSVKSPIISRINDVFNGIHHPNMVKLIGSIFHLLSPDQRCCIFSCLDQDVRLYSYSLKFDQSHSYLSEIVGHLKDVKTFMAIKAINPSLLEYLWDISDNVRVLNEILALLLPVNWKVKKFPVKRNVAQLLIPQMHKLKKQLFVYRQLKEYAVVLDISIVDNDPLVNMNNRIENCNSSTSYIPYPCCLYSLCMSLILGKSDCIYKSSVVMGPLAYRWIKTCIFKCIMNDDLSRLSNFITKFQSLKSELCLSAESSNSLSVLFESCTLWVKLKTRGLNSMSDIRIKEIRDEDINDFALVLTSFYNHGGELKNNKNSILGHCYNSIIQYNYMEAFKSFDIILQRTPSTIIDKLILYESFYLLLPLLYLIKSPKLLLGLAKSILAKYTKYGMSVRCYKIQYWLDYVNLIKNKPISCNNHYSNLLLQSDVNSNSLESLNDLKSSIGNYKQGISWLHDDFLEIEYRLLKTGKIKCSNKIHLLFNSSSFMYKTIEFKMQISKLKEYLKDHGNWVNNLLFYPSTAYTNSPNTLIQLVHNVITMKSQIIEIVPLMEYTDIQYIVACLVEISLINHYLNDNHDDKSELIADVYELIGYMNPASIDVADLSLITRKQMPKASGVGSNRLMLLQGDLTNCMIFVYNNKIVKVPFDLKETTSSDEWHKSIGAFTEHIKALIDKGQAIIKQNMDAREWWKQRKYVDGKIRESLELLNKRLEIGMTVLLLGDTLTKIGNSNECGLRLAKKYKNEFKIDGEVGKDCNTYSGILHILIDAKLTFIPIESTEVCQNMSLYRIPNLHFKVSAEPHKVTLSNGVYILNPGTDLVKTEERLNMKLQHMEWKREKSISENKWFDLLGNDIFMYCGHGAGEKYYNPTNLSKNTSNSVVFLMGCSSLKSIDYGITRSSIAELYLNMGCRAVIGTLWDITDKDLDVQTISMLEGLQFKKDTSKAIQESRQECKLKYLNASSLVCYGNPVVFE
eukprot:NODE_364_length_10092_cov_0.435905.p1 type:complete len:1040 gc:universal NODE_364_length_10092_cov_0.435905:4107-988(-)